MKSELVEEVVGLGVAYFPALFKSNSCGAVILFESEECGIVVVGSENQDLGAYCSSYISCHEKFHWTRLPSGSQVILTQE